MTPSVRRLALLALTAAILAVLGAFTAAPAAATHGHLSASRTPGGTVPAGSTVAITATIENADPDIELLDATLDVPLDPLLSPYVSLVRGSVTALWREQDSPIPGTITSGNDPGDTRVSVHVDFLPAGQHIDVGFRVLVASPLPAGVDASQVQIFLTYTHGVAQSIPWYMPIPIAAQPDLDLTKSDFGASFQLPGPSGVTYGLAATNRGTQDATGVVLADTVPAGTHFDPAGSDPAWSCTPDTGPGSVCTLDAGGLAVGQTRGFGVRLVVDGPAVPAGLDQVRNVGSIHDDGTNSNDPGLKLRAFAVETTPVIAAPDLALTKSDGGTSAEAGARVVYTLAYRNSGTQDATGVVLRETVPDHAAFDATASDSGWACGSAGGVTGAAGSECTLALGGLAAGASGSAAFAVRTAAALPAGASELVNVATITDDGANGSDLTPSDNQARDTTPLLAAPDLSLSKVDGDVTAHPGEGLAYGLTVRNAGTQAASGVVIEETVPEHTRFDPSGSDGSWSCSGDGSAGATCTAPVATLGAGASRSLAFSVTVAAAIPAGVEQLVNTATVHDDGANGPDPTPGNNSATEPTPIVAAPDLSVAKSDGGVTARPGETVRYTLTYRNRGGQDATGVTLQETLPAATVFAGGPSDPRWTCSPAALAPKASASASASAIVCTLGLGDLAAGTSGSVQLAVTVDGTVPAGLGELLNSATIADDGTNGPDPTPADNATTETTPVDAAPVLSLTKSDGGATTRPGEVLTYQLTLSNQGDRDAAGVVLEETVPDHTTFAAAPSDPAWVCAPSSGVSGSVCTLDVGPLPAGASSVVAFSVSVDASLPAAVGQLANRATLRDGGGHEDTADETTPVDATAVLTLAKSDGDAIPGAGDLLAYSLAFGNTGDRDAAGAVLEEIVPDHTTFAAASSDSGWACSPAAGPAGSLCTLEIGPLAAGAAGTASFAVTVDDPLPAAGTGPDHLLNAARLTDDVGDDALAEEVTPLHRPAGAVDLAIDKTDGGVTVQPGDLLVYRLTVRNVGDRAASGVVVQETVPEHTTFSAASSDPAWSCTPAVAPSSGSSPAPDSNEALKAERIQNTGSVRSPAPSGQSPAATPAQGGSVCTAALGTLATGDSVELAFAVTVDQGVRQTLPAGTADLVNTATVQDDGTAGPDADPTNNRATVTTPVDTGGPSGPGGPGDPTDPGGDTPVLAATLSDTLAEDRDDSGGVTAGDVLAYSVRVTNAGPGTAEDVVFDLPALAHLTALPASVRGAAAHTLPPGASALRVALGDLPEGASAAFAWDAAIDGTLPATLRALSAQGQVTALGVTARPSDDPDTPAPDDPTLTPLASSGGPPGPGDPVDVPTLSEWGLLLLTLLLSLAAWRVLR